MKDLVLFIYELSSAEFEITKGLREFRILNKSEENKDHTTKPLMVNLQITFK